MHNVQIFCGLVKSPTTLERRSNTTLRILSVKGGGGTPQISNPFFAEKKNRKGGRGVPPKSDENCETEKSISEEGRQNEEVKRREATSTLQASEVCTTVFEDSGDHSH